MFLRPARMHALTATKKRNDEVRNPEHEARSMDGRQQSQRTRSHAHQKLSNSAATGEQKARDRSLQGGNIFTMDASFSNGDQQGCLVSVRVVVSLRV